jgi:hypothetical protein
MSDEGIKNGNIAMPAVNMVPTDTRQLAANAARVHRSNSSQQENSALNSAVSGAPHIQGHLM